MLTTLNMNGQAHTLLPHNGWSTGKPIRWSRKWTTGVGAGVKGNEARSALRQFPLHKLVCDLIAASLPERARMDARIDQASVAGWACIPFFGRADVLTVTANAGTNTVTVGNAGAWTWTAGDWIFLGADDVTFDALQVTAVAGNVLTLAGNLVNSWSPGNVWPLLFGKFSAQKMTPFDGTTGQWSVTIEQAVAERTVQVGNVPAVTAPGIGKQKIGETNNVT